MRFSTKILCIAMFTAIQAFSALTFVRTPSLTDMGGGQWQVAFEVSETTDVEVSIVDVRDSSVVRHLAAGLLGSNPPPPLSANTLHQTFTWDGRDDFGALVPDPGALTLRVRAGLSAELVNIAGEDLYNFSGSARSTPSIVQDDDGSVLIYGLAKGNAFLRKYDASGNYVKTVYPPSAAAQADSVMSYGINVLPGSQWAPKAHRIGSYQNVVITPNSYLNSATGASARLLPIGRPGELVIANCGNTSVPFQVMGKDGNFTNSTVSNLLTAPPVPAGYNNYSLCGPKYFTASHDPGYLYLSGWYYGVLTAGSWLISACDTGFWADGQVFKVNRATGVATSWLKLDSVPVLSADRQAKIGGGANATAVIHGVAVDDSGHVFVCDRLHQCIGVYDTNAVRLGSIPCIDPDFVAVSRRTGVIYVLTRRAVYGSGSFMLRKFSGWRSPGPAVATLSLTTAVDDWAGAPAMVLTESGSATSIYIGYGSIGFRLYADNGTSFGLVRDFSENKNSGLVFERIAVNRATEQVFWMNMNYGTSASPMRTISDWSNPVTERVYYTAGRELNLTEFTIAPNGNLYGRSFDYYHAPITRYSAESLHVPLPYGNTSGNAASCSLHYEGSNQRGVAAGWQGQLAAFDEATFLIAFPDTGYVNHPFTDPLSQVGPDYETDPLFTGTVLQRTLHDMAVRNNLYDRNYVNGVRFDPAGNVYVGVMYRGGDAITPQGFESDNAFNRSGSIVKFAAGTRGVVNGFSLSDPLLSTNAAKIYPQPFGPFSGDGGCNCRNPYFDVDPYGRLFVPNGSASQLYVSDNAGNTILVLGEYGNTDSRGRLAGPGEVLSQPDIPLAWPSSVAASEDYIYVADAVNARIVRVRMAYQLENVSITASENAGLRISAPEIRVAPNPFNPALRISLALPEKSSVRLLVYGVNGRVVRTLAAGNFRPGAHTLTWDGRDNKGTPVSTGIYVLRLEAGKCVRTCRAVLAK
jgi:hypothetical protein